MMTKRLALKGMFTTQFDFRLKTPVYFDGLSFYALTDKIGGADGMITIKRNPSKSTKWVWVRPTKAMVEYLIQTHREFVLQNEPEPVLYLKRGTFGLPMLLKPSAFEFEVDL